MRYTDTATAVMEVFSENTINSIRRKKKKPVYQVPEGVRVYAIGDIHGCADLLKQLHESIVKDADSAENENKVVYLGDYLDRGPYVRQAIDEAISGLPDTFTTEYLSGNHETLFLSFLKDADVLGVWLDLGGHSTLLNYGVHPPGPGFSPEQAEEIRLALLGAVPPKHMAFFKKLKPYVQIGDFFFAHAGIRPGIHLNKQAEEDLFWIRAEFLESRAEHGAKIVHGHTIASRVQDWPNRLGVDTGAYATGVLTCAVLEKDQIRFLSTRTKN